MSGGIQASLGGRYAIALFDLAREGNVLATVEASLARVADALSGSDDFRRLTTSPLVTREDAERGVAAAATEMGLDPVTTKFLGVLARGRRLDALPPIMRAFRQLASRHRGETSAGVTSAHPLTEDQVVELRHQLRQRVGREVSVDLSVDPQLLGGLVVRIGSQMIDSSIRTRLHALASAMKG